jgi:hypothetical protein
MGSIGHPVSQIWSKQRTNVRLKLPSGQSPGLLDKVWQGWTKSGGRSREHISFQNLPLSSKKLGHKGHLNIRKKFPKEVFSKSEDFTFDFGLTQKLEPWIHS